MWTIVLEERAIAPAPIVRAAREWTKLEPPKLPTALQVSAIKARRETPPSRISVMAHKRGHRPTVAAQVRVAAADSAHRLAAVVDMLLRAVAEAVDMEAEAEAADAEVAAAAVGDPI